MLTLKTQFKLCSKRFEKENLAMNKDSQDSTSEGSPNRAKKGVFFPRDL